MDGGAWRATVHGVTSYITERFSTHLIREASGLSSLMISPTGQPLVKGPVLYLLENMNDVLLTI